MHTQGRGARRVPIERKGQFAVYAERLHPVLFSTPLKAPLQPSVAGLF